MRRQRETYRDSRETAALKTMLPWLVAHVEQTRREMGDDFWPYGLEPNRAVLATFLRYSTSRVWRRRGSRRMSCSYPRREKHFGFSGSYPVGLVG